MPDLADIERIAEQRIERPTREALFTGAGPITGYAELGAEAIAVKLRLEQPHAAQGAVALEYMSDRGGFAFDDHQLAVTYLIAERDHTTHPHALALGSRNLVADALARDLAFELGEREQHVEG